MSGFESPDLERPGRLPHQQGLCEARLGYRDGSPQLGGPGPELEHQGQNGHAKNEEGGGRAHRGWCRGERERERERESFIRNNLHNGVVSGAARGQALLGPMWAGLTPDSKGDPTGDTEEPDRRRQETPHLSARRKGALPASPGGPPSSGQKKLRVLNPILRLY